VTDRSRSRLGHGRQDLLEILDDRYARRGTLLASRVPVDHWHDVVGDPTVGDAILDRLLNNAHRVTLKGAFDDTVLRLAEVRLNALDFNPHTPNPPPIHGDRHCVESAIGLAESVIGIAGIRTCD